MGQMVFPYMVFENLVKCLGEKKRLNSLKRGHIILFFLESEMLCQYFFIKEFLRHITSKYLQREVL